MWEKVYDSAVRLGVPAFGENDMERGIYIGIALAALAVLALVVLWILLQILFRRRSLRGITLKRPNGTFFIARQAIQSVLFRLSEELPALEITKVVLFRRHGAPVLSVSAVFDSSVGSFDVVAEKFQKRALEELKSSLGVDTVKSVNVHLAKVTGQAPLKAIAEPADSGHEPPAGI